MAETSSALADAPFAGDVLSRAEEFARESFVLPGEDAAQALAPGTARRAALEDAIKEIDSGREQPSVEWRRDYSLMLGLERLLSQEEPHLADGATLNAHQVDALSGTLIALTSELQIARSTNGRAPVTELPSSEVEIEGDELPDEEPLDWDPAEEAEEEAASEAAAEDPGAARRFWFEHATGAGKTVAAMGFVEASRTGGILILTHRRNLVDQFLGELRARGYRDRISAPLLKNGDGEPPAGGPVTVETYQWFVRNAGKISDAYTIVICDEAHTALGEKTSASIRQWLGPVFIGMTATGALIARHVTDLFPTQTSRFDLAQAARRGVIAPLRCVRIPPGVGVRSIANVPLRKGEVDQDFDQEELAALLDQTPFNLAVADLYKTRFKDVPGVVYSAGVKHAHNVAKAFQDAGMKAKAVSGETPKRELTRILAAYERGEIDVLVNAQLLAEGWNSPRATVCMHLAPTASKRIYQQRVGRVTRRDARQGGRHRRRLRAPGDDERRPGRDAALAARPRRLPRRRDRRRARAPRPRPAAARGAARRAGHGRPGAARAGVRARAVADRRGAPELGRAAGVGHARRRAGGVEQLAAREGDAALRLDRRAAAAVPGHLPAAQPQHAAAPAGAERDRRRCATRRRSTTPSRSWAAGRATSAARASRCCCRRWPRSRSGGATRRRAGSGTWPSTRARCTRSTRCSAGRRPSGCSACW